MGDLLLFGAGVVLVPGLQLVLVRLRRGRWRRPDMPNRHLPPPAGHRVGTTAVDRTMECSCGWRHTLTWAAPSRAVNRARLEHYFAVETERLAQRLGVDAASVLDRVAAASGASQQVPGAVPRLEPARPSRRALEARRASAIARVEAGRALPEHTGSEG